MQQLIPITNPCPAFQFHVLLGILKQVSVYLLGIHTRIIPANGTIILRLACWFLWESRLIKPHKTL